MSYSTAYLVMNDGRILEEAEYRNGHGTGPRVWSPMARRFFPGARGYYDILGRGPQEAEQERRFWDLYKNPTVPRAWRAAMLFTFDYAVIERERFMEVAALLEQFSAESERFLEHSHVNHLPAIAVLLRANAGREDVRGACFQQTSVSEDLWFRYDEEKDESLPRDVNGPDICWVGALLDQYEPKQEGAAP